MKHPSIPPCGRAARLALALLLTLAPAARAFAQGAPEPRRDQLLNGLRIVTLSRPGDPQLLLRLRVHTGAAFDLAGKEGLMALLADAFFDAQTRDYVTEELGGRLEVSTGYDSVDVTLAGRAADFERLLELVRNAVVNTQLTPDAVGALRAERLKALGEKPPPAARADHAVAARLFNVHPYGRPAAGTAESVARVERPDLLLARERFLNPNNATLVIVGGVEHRRVMNALRQTIGVWRKSDRLVPETFRRPEPTDARVLVINEPDAAGVVEVRLAVRGLARADRDRPAAQVLAHLVRERWAAAFPEIKGRAEVRHEAHRDGGLFLLSASTRTAAEASKALETARAVLDALSTNGPSPAELDAARRAYADTLVAAQQGPEGWAASWLDEHSYKTTAVTAAETERALVALTPAEAQRVAARLFQHTPSASVAVGDAAALRTELARLGVEVFGEAASGQASQPATPPPPAPTPTKQPALQLKRP